MSRPTVVTMHGARTHLSRLVERVEGGEEIVIGRAGTPVATLVPSTAARPKRTGYGASRGRVWIADAFDDPVPPEILDPFSSACDLDR